MEFSERIVGHEPAIATLFTTTFTASEGADEGALIGDLVARLLAEVPRDALRAFTAWDDGRLVGGVVFTPLTYPDPRPNPRKVMLLSPMAVAPDRQGEGIGQGLIAHALDALRAEGTDIAVTYGDPAFYGKTGFAAVTEAILPAPLPLSYPHGWIAQSLTDAPLTPLAGPATCVPPFKRAELW